MRIEKINWKTLTVVPKKIIINIVTGKEEEVGRGEEEEDICALE